jgi:hypothetical protein
MSDDKFRNQQDKQAGRKAARQDEVEGHVDSQGEDRVAFSGPEKSRLSDESEVEGHIRMQGPERAFGTEGAAKAARRPEDDPEPADGKF